MLLGDLVVVEVVFGWFFNGMSMATVGSAADDAGVSVNLTSCLTGLPLRDGD